MHVAVCHREKGGAYYNTKALVRELEALLRKLPDPSDSAPRPARPDVGTARKLDAQQTQELIEAYRAGSTAYELGDRFGINRNGRQDPHPQRRPD